VDSPATKTSIIGHGVTLVMIVLRASEEPLLGPQLDLLPEESVLYLILHGLVAERNGLRCARGQVPKCIRHGSVTQGLITAMQLGVGLFNQQNPYLLRVLGAGVERSVCLVTGYSVIDHHVPPLPLLKEAESVDALKAVLSVGENDVE
jgi:hypothetical protein